MNKRQTWQVLIVAVMVAGYSGYYLCRSNLSVALPLIIDELVAHGWARDAATVRLGSMVSVGILAYALGKFASGTLADFIGGRANFLLGMFGSVCMTVLFALSGTLPIFTLAWIGNRAVQSLGWVGIVKISSRWFHHSRYGAVMAIISLSYLFGDALSRKFLAGLLEAGFGWRGLFFAAAGVLSGLLVLALLLLRDSPADLGELESETSPLSVFRDQGEGRPADLRALLGPLLRDRSFIIVCILSLVLTLVRETFNTWTPTYFHEGLGLSAAAAANASALFPLFGGISVLIAGFAADRLGTTGRGLIIVLGLGLATIALLMLARGGVAINPQVALVTAIGFLLIGPYSYLAGAIALDFGGKHGAGSAAGLIDGIGYLGGVLAGDTFARLTVSIGWSGAFQSLAVLTAVGTVSAALYLRQTRRATAQ